MNAGTANPAHKFVYSSCGSFGDYRGCKSCFKWEPFIFAGHPGNTDVIPLKHVICVISSTPSFVIWFLKVCFLQPAFPIIFKSLETKQADVNMDFRCGKEQLLMSLVAD